jgi:hypothetical protein
LQLGAIALLIAIAAGSTLLIIAMFLYAGGSVFDPHGLHHSLWFNFLCDLTSDRALNGMPNVPGGAVARAGMVILAVAMGMFWLILPALFPDDKKSALVVRIFGGISALGFPIAPLASGPLHAVAIFSASIPALVAGVTGFVAILVRVRDRWVLGAAAGAIAATVIDSVLYARRVIGHLANDTPALPVFQRIAALFVVLLMVTVGWRILRR